MKKTVSIILCAALSLAVLTACGSAAATPTPEPVLVPEPTAEATPEPTAEPTPTPTPEPTPEPVSDPLVMYKDILDVYAQALTENYGGEELIVELAAEGDAVFESASDGPDAAEGYSGK